MDPPVRQWAGPRNVQTRPAMMYMLVCRKLPIFKDDEAQWFLQQELKRRWKKTVNHRIRTCARLRNRFLVCPLNRSGRLTRSRREDWHFLRSIQPTMHARQSCGPLYYSKHMLNGA